MRADDQLLLKSGWVKGNFGQWTYPPSGIINCNLGQALELREAIASDALNVASKAGDW